MMEQPRSAVSVTSSCAVLCEYLQVEARDATYKNSSGKKGEYNNKYIHRSRKYIDARHVVARMIQSK